MKNFLKSSFSIFLAITIVFSSALVGLNEIDFGEIELKNPFEIKTKAVNNGMCGYDLLWTLDDEGTLTISGTGDMYDYSYYNGAGAPWYTQKKLIKAIVIGSGVTSIGDSAFYDCDEVTSVTISDGVTAIGKNAFFGCSSLTSITIPGSVKEIGEHAFAWCFGLAAVTFNNGVRNIGEYAFKACSGIVSVVIPNSARSIGEGAFEACSGLTSVSIGNGVTSIGEYAFKECANIAAVEIGSNVATFNGNAFDSCTRLEAITVDPENEYFTSVDGVMFNKEVTKIVKYPQRKTGTTYVIPDTIRIIGNSAFSYCTRLTEMVIPNSITSIGDSAFASCSRLTSIEIPEGVINIGNSAFASCRRLISIVIPVSVKNIGDSTFSSCTSLTSVEIPEGITSIGANTFSSCISLISISIPTTITSIGSFAFENCTGLESVYINSIEAWCDIAFSYDTHDGVGVFEESNPLWYAEKLYINGELAENIIIPDTVTRINNYTFCGFDGLAEITIPDTVTSIGISAFEACTSLASITIPNSVTCIEDEAFRSCSSLATVKVGAGVNSIGYCAFAYCNSLKSVYIDDVAAWCNITFAPKDNWDYLNNSFGYSNPLYYAENLYVKGVLAKDVVIPDGVASISAYAFYGYGLTSIIIPVSVKSIGNCAFMKCDKLKTVYYDGSKEAWKTISFTNGNDNLKNATITKPKCSKPTLKAVSNIQEGVKITWGKVAFADSYRVYRKAKGGKWSYLASAKNAYFTDTTAKSGTTYYYSVCAKNDVGISDRSSALSIKRLSTPKLSSVSNTSSGIKISWKKVTGASGYIVYRKSKSGKWVAIKKTSSLYFVDKKAKSETTYFYTVRAYSGSEKSSYDTEGLSLRRIRTPKISSATSKRNGILVKWDKVIGASGYYVYRKTSSGNWKKIATVKGNAKIKYLDRSTKKGVTYKYRVKAYYGKSTSYYSNTYKVKSKY